MGAYVVKLPDVGEGVAEEEIVEWKVAVGDIVREDMLLASVMTDKATVEVPAPVDGTAVRLGGEIGDRLAAGSALVHLEVTGEGDEPVPDYHSPPARGEPTKPEPNKQL